MAIDVRREQQHIWGEYSRFFRQMGEDIVWFKFDTDISRYDDIYDEGGKSYKPGIRVPALWIDQIEDPEQYSGEGRRPTQRLRFAVSSSALALRGISPYESHGSELGQGKPADPFPPQPGRPSSPWLDDRLNDVVFYDGRFYAISNFQIRGRLKTQDVIIGVAGIELIPEDESVFDFFPYGDSIMEPIYDASTASSIDIYVRDGSPSNFFTIEFDLTGYVVEVLEFTWKAVADNGDERVDIPIVVAGSTITLTLDSFVGTEGFQWELIQISDTGQYLVVYKGTIYDILMPLPGDPDSVTETMDLYLVDDTNPSIVVLTFEDPDTQVPIDISESQWEAYVELPSHGIWAVPVDVSAAASGDLSLDFTSIESKITMPQGAEWYLLQIAPTGQILKPYEGVVYLLEQVP